MCGQIGTKSLQENVIWWSQLKENGATSADSQEHCSEDAHIGQDWTECYAVPVPDLSVNRKSSQTPDTDSDYSDTDEDLDENLQDDSQNVKAPQVEGAGIQQELVVNPEPPLQLVQPEEHQQLIQLPEPQRERNIVEVPTGRPRRTVKVPDRYRDYDMSKSE